jgi:hypothetical protein
MSKSNNTTKTEGNQYHHLSYEQRRKFLFEIPFFKEKRK